MQRKPNREQLYAPYDWYRQMRETQPVYYDPDWRAWHVFRYADVARVLNDYTTFSSDENRYVPAGYRDSSPISSSILRMDPPRHRQLRHLVSQAFTPRMVAQLESRIKEITNSLLDQVAVKGEMDAIRDLAYPLPVTVIAELLGIPTELREDFKRWSDALVSGNEETTEEERQVLFQEIGGMFGYFSQVLQERRSHPHNDLVSALLAAEVDGEHLSDQELLGFCGLLLVAGNETTTNLIGNLLLCLDENPGVVERLRANRALVPGALEEALRYYSPIKTMTRYASTETTIGDQRIEASQLIIPWISAANRDETEFPDADRFDIEREPNRHLGFGRGIHFCLGAPLAHLEVKKCAQRSARPPARRLASLRCAAGAGQELSRLRHEEAASDLGRIKMGESIGCMLSPCFPAVEAILERMRWIAHSGESRIHTEADRFQVWMRLSPEVTKATFQRGSDYSRRHDRIISLPLVSL